MTDCRPNPLGEWPYGRRLAGVMGVCLALWGTLLSTPPAIAQTDGAHAAVVGVRLQYDQDSCPAFAEVYLEDLADTIGAFELNLSWDRPDFARFETANMSPGPVMAGDSAKSAPSVSQPLLERDSSTLGDWEYVEARGESGLWVKVTAIACLTVQAPERLLYPGPTRLLFRLPLVAGRPAQDFLADGTAIIRFDPLQSRLSRPDSQLLDSLRLRADTARIPACRRAASPVK